MKQLLFLLAALVTGGLGSLVHPFWPLMVYYMLAILRPQYLWDWALPVDWRWSLVAAMMVLGAVIVYLPRLRLRGRWTMTSTLTAVYAGTLGVSCLTAYDPNVAQTWGIEYGKIILMASLAILMIDRMWQVRAMVLMAMIALAYIAWDINYTYVVDGRLDVFHKGFGGLDNNGTGLMLALGLPLAYAFGMTAQRYWQRFACVAIALVILHAIMMTYSRGAMVASVGGVCWLLLRHRSKAQAVAIALLLALAVSFLAGKEIRERFMSTADFDRDEAAQLRIQSWSAAWQIAWDQPLTGQGIRNSNQYSYTYGADRNNRTIHSQYLQVAADSGIPAMVVYTAILIISVSRFNQAVRLCREYEDRSRDKRGKQRGPSLNQTMHLAVGCQSALITFMIGAVFLSLEFFEISWLLIVLATVLPRAAQQQIADAEEEQASTDQAVLVPGPGRTLPGIRSAANPTVVAALRSDAKKGLAGA